MEYEAQAEYDSEEDEEYEYDEPVEVDTEENEAEHETGDELVVAVPEHDAASVISSVHDGQKEPESILRYPTPTETEDESGLLTDEETDWEPPTIRKRKVRDSCTPISVYLSSLYCL